MNAKDAVLLSRRTLEALQANNINAQIKHGLEHSTLNPHLPVAEKMAILGEEFGELFREFTYDQTPDPTHSRKIKELLQIASVAAGWAQCLHEDAWGQDEGWGSEG